MENNLAETAFYVKQGSEYQIRWFTSVVEVNLCGHATLATAFVLFNLENHIGNTINFHSHKSGVLSVTKKGEILMLNFLTDKFEQIEISKDMLDCFNVNPTKVFKGQSDYMFIYKTEDEIKNMISYLDKISKLQDRGVIITAKGNEVDFVSRFFAPQSGIDEDPVTGSAHTTLIPYWSKELGEKN